MKNSQRYKVTVNALNTTHSFFDNMLEIGRGREPQFASFGRGIKPNYELDPCIMMKSRLQSLLRQANSKSVRTKKNANSTVLPKLYGEQKRLVTNISITNLDIDEENYCVTKSRIHSRLKLTSQARQLIIDVIFLTYL